MTPNEREILEVAAISGVVAVNRGGPHDAMIAGLVAQGLLRFVPKGPDEAQGLRRYEITKQGRARLGQRGSGRS